MSTLQVRTSFLALKLSCVTRYLDGIHLRLQVLNRVVSSLVISLRFRGLQGRKELRVSQTSVREHSRTQGLYPGNHLRSCIAMRRNCDLCQDWKLECSALVSQFARRVSCAGVALTQRVMRSVDDSSVLRDWDVETGKCISTMPAHELGIKCVEARDGIVMTGSLDMSVKLWDASSFNSIATLDCVGDSVMGLEIVAGSWLLAAGALARLILEFDTPHPPTHTQPVHERSLLGRPWGSTTCPARTALNL